MKSSKILGLIKKYGMTPATKREVSLLTMSTVTLAYEKFLEKEVGFSYKAIIFIDEGKIIEVFMNEEYVADKTEELLKKDPSAVMRILARARSILDCFLRHLNKAEKKIEAEPEDALRIIADYYIDCMRSMGIYNCFWRYAAVRDSHIKLSPGMVEQIAKDRDENALAYHRVEKLIARCAKPLGKKYNFDGNLLKYMTYEEFKLFLSKKSISEVKLKELAKRKKGYLHLRIEGKEYVVMDKKTIKGVKSYFGQVKNGVTVIKGKPAYPGIVKGYVFNIMSKDKYKPKETYVLVTYMTKPQDTPLVNKCSALVTDEGGILCHAAIISREMKKPCIIGTKNATKVLKDGDYVEVDADNGVVRVIKK
jgi:phosphohistidine swiveling domain-containing protein